MRRGFRTVKIEGKVHLGDLDVDERIILKLRRWADKFCLHCNILIYMRHIWIKQVLCSRIVSLFHHISP